jgi:hypothetical protein
MIALGLAAVVLAIGLGAWAGTQVGAWAGALAALAGLLPPPLCQDQVRHQGQPLLVELEG